MLLLTTTTPLIWIVLVTLGFGVTLGTTVSANQTTLYTQVSANQIRTASGLLRTFGYVGSIASSAIIAVGFHGGVSDAHLHSIALGMVAVSVLGVVIVVADRTVMSRSRAGHTQPTAPGGTTGRETPMTVTTLDPTPALVVIDLQEGPHGPPTSTATMSCSPPTP